MSAIQTMQVGSLELRKNDKGWQYLSEGFHSEPDQWLDAAGNLGPFSNAGAITLLDELLAARVLSAEVASRVCENCRHWDHNRHCDFIDTINGVRVAATTGCEIIAEVQDDSGLWTSLKTGPKFSCPNFDAAAS
ncbi:hypothetical protein ACI77O_12185 [Pseudomonas tritici]|uniref:hypothetical protein n=1 Tax=Pseudomonas tritici TaxID=2745518 RepID=UPI00387A9E71